MGGDHIVFFQLSDEVYTRGMENTCKLYPTLRMDVMSLHILCQAGLKVTRFCQVGGKYMRDYKKAQLKHGRTVETCYDFTSILKVGWSLKSHNPTIFEVKQGLGAERWYYACQRLCLILHKHCMSGSSAIPPKPHFDNFKMAAVWIESIQGGNKKTFFVWY